MEKADIIIIGAGAAGLMAARELSKSGKKVIILEARGRVGGRIWPLSREDFGVEAQGGAEFVHGEAKVTHALLKEAGLTYVPTTGEFWGVINGKLVRTEDIIPGKSAVGKKLHELKEDMPIAVFLEKYFGGKEYDNTRTAILRLVSGYDAADPSRVSSFYLRDDWLGHDEKWQHGKVKEGYGTLLNFLESECVKGGVEFHFNQMVKSVEVKNGIVEVLSLDGKHRQSSQVIVTVPLPIISHLRFVPPLPDKVNAASKIGFGHVIKILLLFKDRWWAAPEIGLSKMTLVFSDEKVGTWWTQYPDSKALLTGWLVASDAEEFKNISSDEILAMAFASLSNIVKIPQDKLKEGLLNSKVANWPADPFVLGSYSYDTVETKASRAKLAESVNNAIFFAGEATRGPDDFATVEGALASGLSAAKEILNT